MTDLMIRSVLGSGRALSGPLGSVVATGASWYLEAGVTPWSAYDPAAAASLPASYVDISGNGRDAGVGVAPTHALGDGWIFNGINQYLTTTFVPQTDQSQTVLVQFTNGSGVGYLFGGTGGGGSRHLFIRPDNGSNQITYRNGNSSISSPSAASGNLGIAGNQGYKNGAADGPTMGAWTGTGAAVFIGARNNVGSPVDYIAASIQRLIIFDVTLTGPQVASLASAMASP